MVVVMCGSNGDVVTVMVVMVVRDCVVVHGGQK